MRKSQISMFVIIGLLIVIIMGFVVYKMKVDNKIEIDDRTPDDVIVKPVVEYVNECLEETAIGAVNTLGEQGLIYPRVYLASTNTKIAYYYFKGTGYFPSMNKIEEETAQFIQENMKSCISDFRSPDFALEDTYLNIKAYPEYDEHGLTVALTYPLLVFYTGRKIPVSEFSAEIDTTFLRMYELAEKIYTRTKQNPEFINLDFINEAHFDIKLIKIDKSTLVYEISDQEGLDNEYFKYRFGVKYG